MIRDAPPANMRQNLFFNMFLRQYMYYLGVPDYSKVATALKSYESTYNEVKVVERLDNRIHELFENSLGLRRRNVSLHFNSSEFLRESWKDGSPTGYSQMAELDNKLYYISCVHSTEVCATNIYTRTEYYFWFWYFFNSAG